MYEKTYRAIITYIFGCLAVSLFIFSGIIPLSLMAYSSYSHNQWDKHAIETNCRVDNYSIEFNEDDGYDGFLRINYNASNISYTTDILLIENNETNPINTLQKYINQTITCFYNKNNNADVRIELYSETSKFHTDVIIIMTLFVIWIIILILLHVHVFEYDY